MDNLTLTQHFALLALNGQDREHLTVAGRMAARCIAAGTVLELQLARGFSADAPLLTASKDSSLRFYQQTVLEHLSPLPNETVLRLVERVKSLHDKALLEIAHTLGDEMMGAHLLDVVPCLLGCDMYAHDNGVSYDEYRAEGAAYTRVAEGLRAEILEDDEMADENVILFWLLRESGCVHDLFSEAELPTVNVQMQKAHRTNELAKLLLPVDIHGVVEMGVRNFLHWKKKAASTDFGIGFNFAFPAFERAQSVFIDTDKLFENDDAFLFCVLDRLHGHDVTVLRTGRIPLLRIDNVLYEAVPSGVQVGGVGIRVPVYGARLRRYPLFG